MPFARAGKDVRQNTIQLKHCQRALVAARAAGDVDARTTAAAERELARAAEAAQNPRAKRNSGLAVFASADDSVTIASPATFASLVTVAPRFYVVPLLPRTARTPAAFILALSRNAVRLVEHATARELPLPSAVPRSLTDAVGAERRPPSLQQHSVGTGTQFHSHGEGEDDVLPELEVYCRRVAHGLPGELSRAGTTVVLAGDVQITAIFRQSAAGWPLLDAQIHGNHDRTAATQLAAFATPLVAARETAACAEWKTLYGDRSAEERASDDPAKIAAAASAGRVATLLLEQSAALDEPRLKAEREPHVAQREGPFNSEAVLTLRSGGDVRILAAAYMPTPAPQAAIFRF